MTLEEFFAGKDRSRCIFDALHRGVRDLGPSQLRVSKSQVAFRRRVTFAWAWVPGMYLRGEHAPLVLTLCLRRKDPSRRWKEVVQPSKGRCIHHMELFSPDEIDSDIRTWLEEAWSQAG